MIRFIHIPKNGGTTVKRWLERNNIEFVLGRQKKWCAEREKIKYKGTHRKAINWVDEGIPKFAVVRNPYSRFVSYYTYALKTDPDWGVSFEEFVADKKIDVPVNVPNQWFLQKSWLVDSLGNIIVDHIFHLENLEPDIQKFFNVNDPIKEENVSRIENYQSYYTEETKKIIYEHFKEDFKLFNYVSKI